MARGTGGAGAMRADVWPREALGAEGVDALDGTDRLVSSGGERESLLDSL